MCILSHPVISPDDPSLKFLKYQVIGRNVGLLSTHIAIQTHVIVVLINLLVVEGNTNSNSDETATYFIPFTDSFERLLTARSRDYDMVL